MNQAFPDAQAIDGHTQHPDCKKFAAQSSIDQAGPAATCESYVCTTIEMPGGRCKTKSFVLDLHAGMWVVANASAASLRTFKKICSGALCSETSHAFIMFVYPVQDRASFA